MSISNKDRQEFLKSLIPYDLLDDAICYISSTLSPEDVFTSEQLEEWAKGKDFYKKTDE